MLGADGNETCPMCYQVMIELYRFNASDDSIGLDRGGWSGGGRMFWEIEWEWEFLARFFSKIRASLYQRRLNRVLRRYPGSLYCSGCGYILKRR
jgi:hypothetical protein